MTTLYNNIQQSAIVLALESDKSLMDRFLAAVGDYSDEEAGALVGATGEWVRTWRSGQREKLQAALRRKVRAFLADRGRPVVQAGADAIEPPSDQTLLELRTWIDRVLPTSGRDRPSVEQMAVWLKEEQWTVIPPGRKKEGGGGGGGG